MEESDREAIEGLLDGLVEATRKGTISWKPVNPTTYVWERSERVGKPAARMVLQILENWIRIKNKEGASEDVKRRFAILQVIETRSNAETPRLSADGRAVKEFNDRLVRLYDIVESGVSEKGIDFLKGILDER